MDPNDPSLSSDERGADEIVAVPPREPGAGSRPGRSGRGPRGLGWVPLLVLAVGLGLSLLLTRHGFFFFFLPIILPFGFGGGSWIRRWRERGSRE